MATTFSNMVLFQVASLSSPYQQSFFKSLSEKKILKGGVQEELNAIYVKWEFDISKKQA